MRIVLLPHFDEVKDEIEAKETMKTYENEIPDFDATSNLIIFRLKKHSEGEKESNELEEEAYCCICTESDNDWRLSAQERNVRDYILATDVSQLKKPGRESEDEREKKVTSHSQKSKAEKKSTSFNLRKIEFSYFLVQALPFTNFLNNNMQNKEKYTSSNSSSIFPPKNPDKDEDLLCCILPCRLF